MNTLAFAATTLKYWYANTNEVRFIANDASYSIYNYSANRTFESQFKNSVTSAAGQWSNVLPINIYETSANRSLNLISGGTYDQLKDLFPDLSTNLAGKTEPGSTEYQATVLYGYANKDVYRYTSGSRYCVVERDGASYSDYKYTATHEMGHMLGWHGHSNNLSDLMYGGTNGGKSLTDRDINHIKQIYDLFR